MKTTARDQWPRELQTLGERIEFARKRVGMTQAALARRLRVAQSGVARLESGERLAELATLIAAARVLDVPVGWLLAGEGALPEPGAVDPSDTDQRRRS